MIFWPKHYCSNFIGRKTSRDYTKKFWEPSTLIKWCWLISRLLAGLRGQILQPTLAHFLLFEMCFRKLKKRAFVDIRPADLVLMLKVEDAKRAKVREPKKWKCIFCLTCTLNAKRA